MRQSTKRDLTATSTLTAVTVLPARGETARQKDKDRRRAKTLKAIKAVEKVRFLKRLQGEDCSTPVMTLADLEKKHIEAAKPKLVTVWDLLIWTYYFQRADEAEWRGRHEGFTNSGSSWDWARQVKELGVIVQGGGQSEFTIARDAQIVHEAVRGLPHERAVSVIESAALAKPPAWQVNVQEARCEPVLKCNGKPKMYLDKHDHVTGCLVVCSGVIDRDRDHMNAEVRERYELWHGSLRVLQAALSTSGLKKHKLQGMGVAQHPWANVGKVLIGVG